MYGQGDHRAIPCGTPRVVAGSVMSGSTNQHMGTIEHGGVSPSTSNSAQLPCRSSRKLPALILDRRDQSGAVIVKFEFDDTSVGWAEWREEDRVMIARVSKTKVSERKYVGLGRSKMVKTKTTQARNTIQKSNKPKRKRACTGEFLHGGSWCQGFK